MAPLEVLPLPAAKEYLNIPAASVVNDAELAGFVPAAVERVERHLGRTLVDAATSTASEVLAVKVVLGEYWRTQRVRARGGAMGGGQTGAAIEADSGPAGVAPLRVRLTELLGDEVSEPGEGPRGAFPAASRWPDPAERVWGVW